VTHVTHSDLLTHLTHDPWPADPLSALIGRICTKFAILLAVTDINHLCQITWRSVKADVNLFTFILLVGKKWQATSVEVYVTPKHGSTAASTRDEFIELLTHTWGDFTCRHGAPYLWLQVIQTEILFYVYVAKSLCLPLCQCVCLFLCSLTPPHLSADLD